MAAAKRPTVYVTVGGQTFAPGDEIPADLAKLIDNPKVWETGDAGDPDEPKAIGDMNKAELEAELAARNAKRPEAEALAVSGTKAELLAVLEADDAAQA